MHAPPPLSRLLLAAAFCATGLASCGGGAPRARPNVLLVSLDTTRADRLGCYGHAAARTPALDGLAAAGTRFTRAYAQVPLTLPSHATLLSGVHPAGHGLRVNFQGALGAELPSLAPLLRGAGYRTGAFVAAWVLNADFGLARGFERYDDLTERTSSLDQQAERPADEVVDAALGWLAEPAERPFFCWVHFYDPHDPYEPPPGFAPEGADPYDGEIAFVDAQLARLLAALEERGVLADTLVVVAGDHGEALGEHGERTHGLFVYEETMRVPLILAGPHVPAGGVVDVPVGLVDLYPTLAELLGLPRDAAVEGRSLAPALRGEPLPEEPVYAESEYALRSFGWAPLRSLVVGSWRYVEAPRPELYDLSADPDELHDRAAELPAVTGRLRDALAERAAAGAVRAAAEVRLAAGAHGHLAGLGYVGGRMGAIEPEELAGLRDPKDAIDVYRGAMRAKHLSDEGRHAEAVALLTPLLQKSPESDEVWSLLANSLRELGRFAEAGEAYEKSLRAVPDHPGRLIALGDCLRLAGDVPGAQERYERALKVDPTLGQAHSRLGLIHAQAGHVERAVAHFEQFVELEPDSVNARCNLANALMAAGESARAIDELERALELDAQCAPALRTLVQARRATGPRAAEVEALQRACAALDPEPALDLRLAWLVATRRESSPEELEAALALALPHESAGPEALDVLAACHAARGEFERAVELAERALEGLPAEGPTADAVRARLALYREGRAQRE